MNKCGIWCAKCRIDRIKVKIMEQWEKIEAAGLCTRYYQICGEHPYRRGNPIESMSATEVLKHAQGQIELAKLKGPGSVYEVQDLPEEILLRFIIQQRTIVETHFHISSLTAKPRGSFTILCHAAQKAAGKPKPKPPYPRPYAYSLAELIIIFIRLRDLALEFYEAFNGPNKTSS